MFSKNATIFEDVFSPQSSSDNSDFLQRVFCLRNEFLSAEIMEPWIDLSLVKIVADVCEIILEKVGKNLENLLKPEQ